MSRAPRVGRPTASQKPRARAGCRAWAHAAPVVAYTHLISIPSGNVNMVHRTGSISLRNINQKTTPQLRLRDDQGTPLGDERCSRLDLINRFSLPGLCSPRFTHQGDRNSVLLTRPHLGWQPLGATLGRFPISSPPSALPGNYPGLLLRRELLGGVSPRFQIIALSCRWKLQGVPVPVRGAAGSTGPEPAHPEAARSARTTDPRPGDHPRRPGPQTDPPGG